MHNSWAEPKRGNTNVVVIINVIGDSHFFLSPGGFPHKQQQQTKEAQVHRHSGKKKKKSQLFQFSSVSGRRRQLKTAET